MNTLNDKIVDACGREKNLSGLLGASGQVASKAVWANSTPILDFRLIIIYANILYHPFCPGYRDHNILPMMLHLRFFLAHWLGYWCYHYYILLYIYARHFLLLHSRPKLQFSVQQISFRIRIMNGIMFCLMLKSKLGRIKKPCLGS